MTRNNLGDQLSWLLGNISICKPTDLSLPPARDPSGTDLSQSQQSRFGVFGSQQELPSRPVSQSDFGRTNARPTLHASNAVEQTTQDSRVAITAEAGSMAKLTSASKTRKPSLAVKQQQQQLLTPSSTTSGGRFQQAITAQLQQQGGLSVHDDCQNAPANELEMQKVHETIEWLLHHPKTDAISRRLCQHQTYLTMTTKSWT